jgi:hypothetical protein
MVILVVSSEHPSFVYELLKFVSGLSPANGLPYRSTATGLHGKSSLVDGCNAAKVSRQSDRASLGDAMAPEVESSLLLCASCSHGVLGAMPLSGSFGTSSMSVALVRGDISDGVFKRPVWNCGCVGDSNCLIETQRRGGFWRSRPRGDFCPVL